MEIDFIVPAKGHSERVKEKNWRPFYGRQSLVDVTITKLLQAGADPKRVYVSSDSELRLRQVCEKWGVHTLLRPEGLSDNNVPLTDWIRAITAQVPGDSDIAWCQVCDPLFSDYRSCFDLWDQERISHDSLVVCYPWRGYLMTAEHQPIGWAFGEHHTPSQRLPQFATMPFTLSVLKRAAIEATGYHIGRTPFWFESLGPHIDIDTERDFTLAQRAYKAFDQ